MFDEWMKDGRWIGQMLVRYQRPQDVRPQDVLTSRDISLIVNQIVFVLLTYSLLQWYLLRTGRKELNAKTRTRTLDLLRPTITSVLIYYQNYVAYLSPLEHQELLLTLNEKARKKILDKTRKLRRSLADQLTKPRAP